MKVFTFDVKLLDPVLVNQLAGGDPNSAIGFDYIPGSVIRGALINQYLNQAAKNKDVDACDDEFRKLFLDGSTKYLNAYPTSVRKKRTVPTPISWFSKKGDEKGSSRNVWDHVTYEATDKDRDDNVIWLQVSEPFCDLTDDSVSVYSPYKRVVMHTSRGDSSNTSNSDSNMFRYEALDSGQVMSAAVIVKEEECANVLSQLLKDDVILRVGKSHLTGYGRIKILNTKLKDYWDEYIPIDNEEEELISVTLLSDTIIRDQVSGSCLSDIKSLLEGPGITVNEIKKFVHTGIRGNFNRTWNLPTPQNHTILAGSVFVYEYNEGLLSKLKELELDGIGDKKVEGFGRIALNWYNEDDFSVKKESVEENVLQVSPIENHDFIGRVSNRLLRSELDRELLKRIKEIHVISPPSNSQLSGIRYRARAAFAENDPSLVKNYLKNMRKSGSDQLEKAKVGNSNLKEWLELLFSDPTTIWTTMNASSISCPLGVQESDSKDKMALEYAVRLVDNVLHKTQKEAKK
ncbi:RAMP superfamily CRISPR-associated protein [Methanosalsum natronophilum]|uniref:RAMP superfamily CRISPR-associated protein n=1 Tax=Methanosalsum natronophilum TaxID=768733 RepID=UPI00216A4D4D|nr:RAMP superfamily CRISPR-associated protein [Methanosalsum natronophilum]MCS3924843.1 CRISPR-associated protein Csx10 [Methanosalsum natronophilum]